MNTTKYIGIDVHQATSVFAIRDHQGKLIGEAVLETKPAAIIDFLEGQRGTVWATFAGAPSVWIGVHRFCAFILPGKSTLSNNSWLAPASQLR